MATLPGVIVTVHMDVLEIRARPQENSEGARPGARAAYC